ncbi:MAG: ZIP family metal transporter [Oscillospiraceae bacterium]
MEEQAFMALLLSLAAGLCTVLGGGISVLIRRPGRRMLACVLGFSGGIMVTVSLADLIPEAAHTLSARLSRPVAAAALTAACVSGMLLALLLDLLLPEREGSVEREPGLLRLGIFSMVALMAHNIPEGMAVFLGGSRDWATGASLAVAIAMHNLPEGILVALPVQAATGNRGMAVGMATLSGLSEPIGALLAWGLLDHIAGEGRVSLLCSGVAGLMIYITFAELLPASLLQQRPGWSLGGVLTGVSVMLLSLALLS